MADRTALILANGDLGDPGVLAARLRSTPFDLVIAADGGARHAAALGLRIDTVVGDLDSLSSSDQAGLSRRGASLHQHPAAKDETDLELAFLQAEHEGATAVVVLGAAGGRLDMTLANVGLLLHPALRRLSIQFWNTAETAYLLRPPGGEIPGEVGDRVSLLPLGSDATGITTQGLAFALATETLAAGAVRGISNRVAEPHPRVAFSSGALLVVHAPQDDVGQGPGPRGS